MYFGSRVQKVVYFPSDNSDLLSSHFSVQSELHYFWTVSARIFVYSQKYTTFGPPQLAFLSTVKSNLFYGLQLEPIPHQRWRPPWSHSRPRQHRLLFLRQCQHRWKLIAVAINLPWRTPVMLGLRLPLICSHQLPCQSRLKFKIS